MDKSTRKRVIFYTKHLYFVASSWSFILSKAKEHITFIFCNTIKQKKQLARLVSLIICIVAFLSSCNISKKINNKAQTILFADSALSTGHIGISIYEPATNTYWYNHNATKYFTPASNTKFFTLYAALKYLPDSLPGIKYRKVITPLEAYTEVATTGDPTFLNSEFTNQPVYNFLKQQEKIIINKPQSLDLYGSGWAWNDYAEPYMRPLNSFPFHGNIAKFTWINKDSVAISPSILKKECAITYPLDSGFSVLKEIVGNHFTITPGSNKKISAPFKPDSTNIMAFLKDTLLNNNISYINNQQKIFGIDYQTIYSQPTDSICKIMMRRSDNFYAEQLLIMASNQFMNEMTTSSFIDSIIKKDFVDIPQQPIWVDGSGLSRYNLFTPQCFVYLLTKMKNDFGFERMKKILPTGGQGTLKEYYKTDSSFIYAKTGTLSNQVSLCGYLITRKNKTLVFSVLINNMAAEAFNFRKAVERFLTQIRNEY